MEVRASIAVNGEVHTELCEDASVSRGGLRQALSAVKEELNSQLTALVEEGPSSLCPLSLVSCSLTCASSRRPLLGGEPHAAQAG